MERLGLARRLALSATRAWSWAGQSAGARKVNWRGPPGHDINYISLYLVVGAPAAIGRHGERPVPPLNLVGYCGGGGMLLANGVVAALLPAAGAEAGQVVDAAMMESPPRSWPSSSG